MAVVLSTTTVTHHYEDVVRQKSWVPIEAPLSPPPTPPKFVGHLGAQTEYFKNRKPCIPERQPKTTVAVIGTGYVGLHLVEAFATAYDVIAFDISEQRVKEVQQMVPSNVACTTRPAELAKATHFLVSVSTILDPRKKSIDVSCIKSAIEMISEQAQPGSTVIIESSVAVGMTRELLQPLMESKGLRCGMSPERVDPGRTYPHYSSIPKVISGLDDDSLSSIQDLYSRVFDNIVTVSKPEVAEMTKLYENCQRMMCIAYANEMADACRQLSATLSGKMPGSKGAAAIIIDPYEVARTAGTKPFGYQPYSPSLGVGGHCIPVNPYYLLSNSDFPLLEACTQRMADRPARIGDDLMGKIGCKGQTRPHVLIVGLGFKRGQSVLSHSPGRALAVHLLEHYDVHVEYADPFVAQDAVPFIPRMKETDWTRPVLQRFDGIVVAVDQPGLDYKLLETLTDTHVEWFCER